MEIQRLQLHPSLLSVFLLNPAILTRSLLNGPSWIRPCLNRDHDH